jgi:Ala-tRNA(Pro) deacylase
VLHAVDGQLLPALEICEIQSLLVVLSCPQGGRRSKIMGIAITLEQYLDHHGIAFDCLTHKRSGCSARTADAAHVSSDCLAKAVVLKRRDGYTLAVLPASRQAKLEELGRLVGRPVGLATEDEIAALFPDCERGAVPPIAAAYALQSFVDESLEGRSDIYFEAGDHKTLVHLSGEQFRRLVSTVPHGQFCDELAAGDEEASYYAGA